MLRNWMKIILLHLNEQTFKRAEVLSCNTYMDSTANSKIRGKENYS